MSRGRGELPGDTKESNAAMKIPIEMKCRRTVASVWWYGDKSIEKPGDRKVENSQFSMKELIGTGAPIPSVRSRVAVRKPTQDSITSVARFPGQWVVLGAQDGKPCRCR